MGRLREFQRSRLGAWYKALGYSYTTSDSGFDTSYGPSLTTSEAGLLSQGISTTGALVSKALTPTPTITYNPVTGAYTAVGAAALPGTVQGIQGSVELESYLPYLLIGGALLLVVSMRR